MSTFDFKAQKPFIYSSPTLARAERSLICSPFKLSLFAVMQCDRVAIGEITGNIGVEKNYTKQPLSELTTDTELVWLIQVGVLRREVDGQGITDSFRLTPLGRQLVEQFQTQSWRNPTLGDRFHETITRWLRIPF